MIPLPSTSTTSLERDCYRLYRQIGNQYTQLQNLLNNGADFVWNNPDGTAQQAVATLGTNAASVFELSNLLCGLIGSITGSTPSPMPVGWSYTANADGTVTLIAPTST